MRRRSGDKAFTLTELLVSLAVVALLIGLLAPALGGARERSRRLASAANVRSVAQLFHLYAQASSDQSPAPVDGRFYQMQRPDALTTVSHWQASIAWPYLLAEMFPWDQHMAVYLAPGARRDPEHDLIISRFFPSYHYSTSFLGDPAIWGDRSLSTEERARLERGARMTMVVHPAAKALLWDFEMPYLTEPPRRDESFDLLESTPVAFVDGHVVERVQAQASDPVHNPAPTNPHPFSRLHNTRHGVHGRDY